MILVVGTFRLPADNIPAAREAMERVILRSREEAGCLAYAYAEDLLDPGLFRVTEAWSDRAALAAHFSTPHMLRWQEERAALGMSGRAIVAYAVGEQEVL